MIAAIHQPQYLPWLGYFDKIDQADVFCFLDDVQYKKNEWQNRNRIKTAQGWQWLTVPVHYRFPQKINQVMIDARAPWRKRHLHAISTNYRKARYFDLYLPFFEGIYNKSWKYLSDLNINVVEGVCGLLGIKKRVVTSSAMKLREDPTDRLVDICLHLGADVYLAGAAGADYMDLRRFEEHGIAVRFQSFSHPTHPQLFGGYISHLSVVDLLMNCGPNSLSVIRQAQTR